MNRSVKSLLLNAFIGCFAVVGTVTANVKHKSIDIKAENGQDVIVWVKSDGNEQSVQVSVDELADSELLQAKLAIFDPDTRKTVLNALKGLDKAEHDGQAEVEKVLLMKKANYHGVDFIAEGEHEVDIEVVQGDGKQIIRKHIIHADGSDVALQSHTDVITEMIKKGKFSPSELDTIQAALDAKR